MMKGLLISNMFYFYFFTDDLHYFGSDYDDNGGFLLDAFQTSDFLSCLSLRKDFTECDGSDGVDGVDDVDGDADDCDVDYEDNYDDAYFVKVIMDGVYHFYF